MEAPDKVYIDDLAVVNDCITKISLKQLPNFSEYIRKDALLEWLKKEYEVSKWFYETHAKPGELHTGKCEAYKQVIDKIESL